MTSQSTQRVHSDLVDALDRLRCAEQSAVTLFARVLHEGMFRSLGYATIELYGTEGRLSWTKARTISAVATARTEPQWIAAAETATSRELEAKVSQARFRNRRERDRLRRHRGQSAMVLPTVAPAPVEIPVTVSITLSPVQHAQFEVLLERLRKNGRQSSRTELLLEGLAALADDGGTRETSSTPYHIVAYTCDACNKTIVNNRLVSPATADAISCDAVHASLDPKVRNRATILPSIRRATLNRDKHTCTTPGCRAKRFLEVHHKVHRRDGGSNERGNLATLCGACHRHHHQNPG